MEKKSAGGTLALGKGCEAGEAYGGLARKSEATKQGLSLRRLSPSTQPTRSQWAAASQRMALPTRRRSMKGFPVPSPQGCPTSALTVPRDGAPHPVMSQSTLRETQVLRLASKRGAGGNRGPRTS